MLQVSVTRNSNQLWLGNAAFTVANLQAPNGVVHILASWPSTDLAVNESAVTVAGKLGDFGPFNFPQV